MPSKTNISCINPTGLCYQKINLNCCSYDQSKKCTNARRAGFSVIKHLYLKGQKSVLFVIKGDRDCFSKTPVLPQPESSHKKNTVQQVVVFRWVKRKGPPSTPNCKCSLPKPKTAILFSSERFSELLQDRLLNAFFLCPANLVFSLNKWVRIPLREENQIQESKLKVPPK